MAVPDAFSVPVMFKFLTASSCSDVLPVLKLKRTPVPEVLALPVPVSVMSRPLMMVLSSIKTPLPLVAVPMMVTLPLAPASTVAPLM